MKEVIKVYSLNTGSVCARLCTELLRVKVEKTLKIYQIKVIVSLTNQGMVLAGAALIALSFMIISTNLVPVQLSFVEVGNVKVGDISEHAASKLFVFALTFTSGLAVLVAGLKVKNKPIRKKH